MFEVRTALITGAASGIGEASVRRFSRDTRYSKIFAADIDPSINSVFPTSKFPAVVPIQIDLRRERQIDEMMASIDSEAGRLDVVVNAAGVIIAGRKRAPYEYFRNDIGTKQIINLHLVNEHAVYWVNERAEVIMRRNGGGTLIMITSSKEYFPDPFRQLYNRSKQNLERVSLANAQRLEGENIRVVVVKPGNTKTNIDRGVWINTSDRNEAQMVQTFNNWWRKTFGNNPEDVADVIYKIAGGEMKDRIVQVGFDAQLGHTLTKAIPFWRQIFYLGAASAYRIAGFAHDPSDASVNLGSGEVLPIDLYEEIVDNCDCTPILPPFFTP